MTLLLEEKDDILYVDFNSPPVNVLKGEILQDMIKILARDSQAKVAVLKGSGKMFCAGLDVKDHLPDKVEEMIRIFFQAHLRRLRISGSRGLHRSRGGVRRRLPYGPALYRPRSTDLQGPPSSLATRSRA